MTSFLVAGALIAQAATCGLLGTPSSPGGCSLPSPDGGSYLLQNVNGQMWVQETPNGFESDDGGGE
jgi:hypothetical protein